MLVLAGLATGLGRLYIYALLTLLILPGGSLLGIEAPYAHDFSRRIDPADWNHILMVRFLRAYPLPKDESA